MHLLACDGDGMSTTSPVRRWAAVVVLAVAAAIAAYYLQVRVSDVGRGVHLRWGPFDTSERGVLLWSGALLAGLAVGLPLKEGAASAREAAAARSEAVRAEARRQEVINGVLSPFASLLGEITDLSGRAAAPRARLQGLATTVVMAGLTGGLLGDGVRVRASYYELKDEPGRRLVRVTFQGRQRSDAPRSEFPAGDPAGDAALDALDQGQARYWREDRDPAPPGWNGQWTYRTFIATPVATRGRLLGMLTVDAPAPDDLSEGDVPTVTLLAQLLAAALNGSSP